MQTPICISLGGSVITNEKGINVSYIERLANLLSKSKNSFIIIVGGGYPNRLYVDSVRNHIKSEIVLDMIGLSFTRINALVVKDFMEQKVDTHPNIVADLDDLKSAVKSSRVVLMSGMLPGLTTDTDAILACESTGAKKLINVGKQPYVHDRDPSEPGAKKFKTLSHDDLIEIAMRQDKRLAKTKFIFDVVASKLAKRSNIELRFVDSSMENLKNAIEGKPHNGTTVK